MFQSMHIIADPGTEFNQGHPFLATLQRGNWIGVGSPPESREAGLQRED